MGHDALNRSLPRKPTRTLRGLASMRRQPHHAAAGLVSGVRSLGLTCVLTLKAVQMLHDPQPRALRNASSCNNRNNEQLNNESETNYFYFAGDCVRDCRLIIGLGG